MNNKIDPTIFEKVNVLDHDKKLFDCVIYSNNYVESKNELLNTIGSNFNFAEFPFIGAFGAKLTFWQISNLANYNHVNYITSSLKVQTQINVSKNIIELNNVNIPRNFCTVVIDTGVSQILDLSIPNNKIIKFVDFINDKLTPYDDNGHGTFVSSVLCGDGTVSNGKYAGVDTMCNLIVIKALDNNGEAGVINILKAMQWIVDNKQKYNIKVVCMSFGSLTMDNNDPLIIGAEVLWDNDICVVAAAGNSGPENETIKSPGASCKIITVGAINDFRIDESYDVSNFEVADFSSRGPALGNYKPDVVAPGVNIKSACNFKLFKSHYKTMSGTSVATPMVAGVCNLLLASNPKLKPNDVKRLILNNAIQINSNRNSEGFGLINCRNFVF